MPTNNTIIQQTQAWLKQVVIGLRLCPFAEHPFSNNKIEYIVCHEKDTEQKLLVLINALTQLDDNQQIETSLIIFSDSALNFDNYLDLLELANALMDEYDYNGRYQLASFHPNYQFEGSSPDNASNYTNRSPYPMLHCLRESSIENALQTFPQPENIPQKNIERMEILGVEHMQHQLDTIMNITEKSCKEDEQNV